MEGGHFFTYFLEFNKDFKILFKSNIYIVFLVILIMTNKGRKLIIIGIDGGTFNVLNPLFQKGLLPNIKKFKNKLILESTIPPGTAVSWASFSTGNLPDKTNIYDFTIVDKNSWKINFVNRKIAKGKKLWNYLDEAGLKSCFINIPLTYPVEEINGVMISGIDAPSKLSNYTHPKEIKEELNKIGYEIEVSGLKDKSEVSDEAIAVLDKRIITARKFLKENFDFFIVLFRGSDVVQHYAWGEKQVEEAYKKIDKFIGEVQNYCRKNNADLIIMSDHGEEQVNKAFNINSWLEKEGYLKTNIKKKSILSYLGVNRERIFKILEKLQLQFLVRVVPRGIGKKIPTKQINFEEAIITRQIDFNKTKAIAKRAVKTAQIFINSEKRNGIVKEEEIKKLKQEIKNKLKKFFEKQKLEVVIKTKEELYPNSENFAPDINLYFKEKGYDIMASFSSNKNLWDKSIEKATHNSEGILLTDMNLDSKNPKIIDLMPTILKYFNIKKGYFDGDNLIKVSK